MEREIYKILLEYKTLQDQKNSLTRLVVEDLSKYGFKENKSGILSSLDTTFQNELDSLFSAIKSSNCDVILYSGKRPVGKLKTSLHPHGKALDIVPVKPECYCKILNLCAQSKFSKLYCLDERKAITPDWSGPHIHIELKQSNKTSKPCDNSETSGLTTDTSVTQDIFGSTPTADVTSPDPLLSDLTKLFYQKYHPGLKEEFNEGFNLEDVKVKDGNKLIFKSNKHPRIFSPVDGKILSISDESCENGFSIMTSDKNYLLQYCNVKGHDFTNGENVFEGQILGTNVDYVTVIVTDKKGRGLKKIPDSLVDTEKNKDKNKTPKDNFGTSSSPDPLLSFLAAAPFKAPGYIAGKVGDVVKKLKKEDETIDESVFRVINDINKIKRLIK